MINLTTQEVREKLDNGFNGVIDFYAEWCGPCKAMAPMLEQVNESLGEQKIFKVNVDMEQDLAREFEIRSIPTLVFFKDGKSINRIVGATSKKVLMESLQS